MAQSSNTVRIGGGLWRSRLLTFPDLPGLRPTPDRVRQTLFNWLGQDLHGLRCLDLFCGTGVMGFEALSRGAAEAVMVEKMPLAMRHLQDNKQRLQATGAELQQQDAAQFLARDQRQFDIIFLDPPYQQNWLPRMLPVLPAHLSAGGYLYVEAEYVLNSCADWQVIKQGKAGNVCYHLLKSAHAD
ncbi:16S rRNA (guanine(966)-N(2))-methyltransferase RsmD [Pseudomethylobacillus aquaticus]|uniref:16S rRNA (Guanine(966)-N(2))-methyltransferase RsmD n=1 Tax=Pseudomethylobacillus aquaticus TaxID=2676064 RepID=A0A3N0UY96_9PROT|nr:16S rRNA (guanine(966)-N(2))-methyltransferase RsmD [Pseudomethylobacillus aquaticus]ROH85475.1 16S rRNA (guanine(966)-N(2))-methyltransferase RsmD [Pseudomethylobacillus aquaticus]